MRFSDFIAAQVERRRGLQSRLARKLKVSRSTITAWRNGTKPEFEMCLLLADHFDLDPVAIFRMLEEPAYERIFLRFFPHRTTRRPPSIATHAKPAASRGESKLSENDLYRNKLHADVHRDLQMVLEIDSPESQAIATMIRLAANSIRENERVEIKRVSNSLAGRFGRPRQTSPQEEKLNESTAEAKKGTR